MIVCLIVSAFNMCALADGYGDSFGNVDDTLPDIIERDFDPTYAVGYNDFESVSGYAGASGFAIENTGNSAYGTALKVPATGWATPGNITNATYTWNGKTQKVFNEQIVEGEDYIFSYEYWSDPEPVGATISSIGGAFTLSPQHDQFWNGTPGAPNELWDGNDFRNVAEYFPDNKWHLDSVAFTAKSTTHSYISGNSKPNLAKPPLI